jgi:hypothetical protein
MSAFDPKELERDLVATYGHLIGMADLRKILGFKSRSAMRRCIVSGALTLNLFEVPGRRGRFTTPSDLAAWLTSVRGSPMQT